MLKIKDNVDLKELEKYGFKEMAPNCYEFRSNKDYSDEEPKEKICWLYVSHVDNDLLMVFSGDIPIKDTWETEHVLFDLIKDGLVIKED